MQCGIIHCSNADNSFLWKCYGSCNKYFHASCIGVKRHQEEVISAFMLPLCVECQTYFTDQLKLRKTIKQQQEMSEHIKAQVESNHALINKFKNLAATHDEELANIEKLLQEIKNIISLNANSTENMATEIRTSVSSLFAVSPPDTTEVIKAATKSAAAAAVATITKTTGLQLEEIAKASAAAAVAEMTKKNEEIVTATAEAIAETIASMECKIISLQDTLKQNERHSVAENVIEEIQALSITVSNLNSNQHQPESVTHPSLAAELAQSTTSTEQDASGWRMLGSKRHWKPDWTDFDRRQRTRRLQEKAADKARRSRKKNRSLNYFNTNHHKNRNRNDQKNRNISNYNNSNNNNNNNRYISNYNNSNNNNNKNRNISNYNNSNNNNNNYYSNNNNNYHNNNISNNNNNFNNSLDNKSNNINNNNSINISNGNNKVLLSDKELLAAAKVQFSTPQPGPSNSKFIHFQKGETLHPYKPLEAAHKFYSHQNFQRH